MYAAVQLSSQQQQMYVANNNDTKRNTINKISKIYQIVFPPFDLHIAAAAFFSPSEIFPFAAYKRRERASFVCGGMLLITHDEARGWGWKKVGNFSHLRAFPLFSRLGICTIARRAYRWRKISTSLFFFAVFRRVKNQKHSIDGQAMKGKK